MTAPGYRLAPIDPVDEMLDAAETVDFANEDERAFACNLWHAMIAKAPQPEPPADLVESATAFILARVVIGQPLIIDPHELAAFEQEHAAAEKARADKAEKALADEREACAQEADVYANGLGLHARAIGRFIAAAIRARKGGGDE